MPCSESTSNMGEHASILYSKIILLKEVDTKSLSGSLVQLEIDKAYTIGKSIAVLKDAVVVGHLQRHAARVVWRFLHSHSLVEAEVYVEIRGRQNVAWYSIIPRCFKIGVKIRFCNLTREDSKLLMAHFTRRKIICFPGVYVPQCPKNLKELVRPIKDENGISSLLSLIE